MKAPSRKAENGVGQPAVESLAGESSRDSEAAHEEEDEMMGESGEGLWNDGLGFPGKYAREHRYDGNKEGCDSEGNGLGHPEKGGQGEDSEASAELDGGVFL